MVRRRTVVGDLGGQQGINYLTSSVVSIEGTESRDFATIQAEHIDAFRAHHPHPDTARVCHGLVVIPTDSASRTQIERYRAYAAGRFERTKTPQGPRGMLFSPDYVGTSDELADALYAHAGFQRADEVAFALPFTFDRRGLPADRYGSGRKARAQVGLDAEHWDLVSAAGVTVVEWLMTRIWPTAFASSSRPNAASRRSGCSAGWRS